MVTVEELQVEVERYKEALRKKEKENEDLIEKVRDLTEGMREMEKRMEERMEEKMAAKMEEMMNKRFADGIGGNGMNGTQQRVTSTPKVVNVKTVSYTHL